MGRFVNVTIENNKVIKEVDIKGLFEQKIANSIVDKKIFTKYKMLIKKYGINVPETIIRSNGKGKVVFEQDYVKGLTIREFLNSDKVLNNTTYIFDIVFDLISKNELLFKDTGFFIDLTIDNFVIAESDNKKTIWLVDLYPVFSKKDRVNISSVYEEYKFNLKYNDLIRTAYFLIYLCDELIRNKLEFNLLDEINKHLCKSNEYVILEIAKWINNPNKYLNKLNYFALNRLKAIDDFNNKKIDIFQYELIKKMTSLELLNSNGGD